MKLKKIKKYIKYLGRILNKDPRFVSEQEYKFKTKLKYLHSNNLLNKSEEEPEIDITQLINNSNIYIKKYNDLLKIHNEHLKDDVKTLNTIHLQDKEKSNIISKLLLEISKQ